MIAGGYVRRRREMLIVRPYERRRVIGLRGGLLDRRRGWRFEQMLMRDRRKQARFDGEAVAACRKGLRREVRHPILSEANRFGGCLLGRCDPGSVRQINRRHVSAVSFSFPRNLCRHRSLTCWERLHSAEGGSIRQRGGAEGREPGTSWDRFQGCAVESRLERGAELRHRER